MRSPTITPPPQSLGQLLRHLKPSARLRLLLLILALCVLAGLLGVYSVPDSLPTGRTFLAAAHSSLVS